MTPHKHQSEPKRTTVRRLIAHLQQLPPDREIVTTFDELMATEDQVACAELLIGALSENDDA